MSVEKFPNSIKKKPRKPLEEENKPGKYDQRNRLNDLTGKEWLLLTKSFWISEPSSYDKEALDHPAPFLVEDIKKLISLFTKQNMLVLDPFVGSGTTLIAASLIERDSIGIDINPNYKQLAQSRLKRLKSNRTKFIVGDALQKISKINDESIDYIVTSPPYFNILKNQSQGTRHYNGKNYRMAARSGVDFYTENKKDLGNLDSYTEFLEKLSEIFGQLKMKLKKNKYITIIMSDFTIGKKEVFVQGDIVTIMKKSGFEFKGTTVLLQNVKPLFPFGYPYAYVINHHHQNIMTFRNSG